MTVKTISTKVTSEFGFSSPYTTLSITSSGFIDVPTGEAIASGKGSHAYTVVNDGRVAGNVYLGQGGILTNGSDNFTGASIIGYNSGVFIRNAVGTVVNYGRIDVSQSGNTEGVYLNAGGALTNGSGVDTAAIIIGAYGAWTRYGSGAVINFGTIEGTGTAGGNASGLYMTDGGRLTNGSNVDTLALIEGSCGLEARSGADTITNFGTIEGVGAVNPFGINLGHGGAITNGSATDQSALIEGYEIGISVGGAAAAVSNFGTIEGRGATAGADAVYMEGGSLTNGGGGDRGALIEGYDGVRIGSVGSVTNLGTVQATGISSYGVQLQNGGALTNGAVNVAGAQIQGYSGVDVAGAGSIANFGTIEGTGPSAGFGELIYGTGSGVSAVNGATNRTNALIDGYVGAEMFGSGTLTNFGAIEGTSGKAVVFNASSEVLAVEAHSVFVGSINGDGGILDLASGTGTIVLTGHNLTVSGSMAATAFTDFDIVRIPTGASFNVSGNNSSWLEVLGGTLTSVGALNGPGRVDIDGGVADLGAGFIENVFFTGANGELKLGSSKTYTGEINGFSKTGTTSLDLLGLGFAGTTTAHYSGSTTSGVLTVTEGTNTAKITLEGNYLSSTFTLSAAPGGGTLVVDPPKAAQATPHLIGPAPLHQFIAAIAGFGTAGAGPPALGSEFWRTPPPTLVASRALA